jgi:putative flippase GtrA
MAVQNQLSRFAFVGCLTVGLDYLAYRLLLWTGIEVGLAKAGGFIVGSVFAWVANGRWTFKTGRLSGASAMRFALLYASTLGLNVLVNWGSLIALASSSHSKELAFVIATGVSATLNFLAMKTLVFAANCRGRELGL